VESDPESDDKDETNTDRMDFQQAEDTAATQATGGTANEPEFGSLRLPLPLSPEHAAIRTDFETITASAMEQLYRRITTDINASLLENTAAFLQTNSELHQQVSLFNARITQMQQQLLVYQCPVQPPVTVPAAPAAKKILKKMLMKKSTTGEDTAKKSCCHRHCYSRSCIGHTTSPSHQHSRMGNHTEWHPEAEDAHSETYSNQVSTG